MPCLIPTVAGHGLADGDHVFVAPSVSCDGSTRDIPGVSEAARKALLSAGQVDFAADLTQIAPGAFALCWCRGACEAPNFRTYIGELCGWPEGVENMCSLYKGVLYCMYVLAFF